MKSLRVAGLGFSALAVMLLFSGRVAADYVPLPSDLGILTKVGNYTTVGGPGSNATLSFTGYSASTNNGVALPPSSINASEFSSVPTLGFELTGPMAAKTGGPTGSQNDIAISYLITTTGPGFDAVGLTANGTMTGSGFAQVAEDIYTDSTKTQFLGHISMSDGTVYAMLSGTYTSLYVTKDIIFNTYDATSTAAFSIVDQTFFPPGDIPLIVPEPATFVMLGLGVSLAGTAAFARSRRKSVA